MLSQEYKELHEAYIELHRQLDEAKERVKELEAELVHRERRT